MNDSTHDAGANPLDRIFAPRSLAIVGASDTRSKAGGRILESLLFNNFAGSLLPINPRRQMVQGVAAYPSLDTAPGPIDLVVLCVPSQDVEAQVEAACRLGVGGLLVLASGFSEVGDAGAEVQQRIAARARAAGIPMVGPNCLGLMNGAIGLVASPTVMMKDRLVQPGNLSFATQSGAIGVFWIDEVVEAGLGISKWISTGNEADIGLPALIEYFAGDPHTKVIGIYLEGIRDGMALRRSLAAALAARKPVVCLRSGRSQAGAAAAASHTGALASDDALVTALFAQYGVCQVDSLAELMDVSRILATQELPAGRRACIISNSGGAGALLTDAVAARGFELPPLSDAVVARLKPHFPPYVQLRNPIDLTDRIVEDNALYEKSLRAVTESGDYEIVFTFMAGRSQNVLENIGGTWKALLPSWHGAHASVWRSGTPDLIHSLKEAKVSVFGEIPTAVEALRRAMCVADAWRTMVPAAAIAPRIAARTRQLAEHAAKAMLRDVASIDVPRAFIAHSAADIPDDISGLRLPVLAKLQSPDLLHKTGSGGIRHGLMRADEIRATVTEMLALAERESWRCEGILIEEMIAFDTEFLVGIRSDPVLGAFLVLGRGGVMVEVDPDISLAFLPLAVEQIERMLRGLRMQKLLTGYRGGSSIDLHRLAAAIFDITEFYIRHDRIIDIEINPLVVGRDGKAILLDALIHEAFA